MGTWGNWLLSKVTNLKCLNIEGKHAIYNSIITLLDLSTSPVLFILQKLYPSTG
jgi:hypothetical protein